MATTPHIFTHSSLGVSHSAAQVNQGSDLRFYLISTAFRRGYYYYLYIYKSHFQADRYQITVRTTEFLPTLFRNQLQRPMSARATA